MCVCVCCHHLFPQQGYLPTRGAPRASAVGLDPGKGAESNPLPWPWKVQSQGQSYRLTSHKEERQTGRHTVRGGRTLPAARSRQLYPPGTSSRRRLAAVTYLTVGNLLDAETSRSLEEGGCATVKLEQEHRSDCSLAGSSQPRLVQAHSPTLVPHENHSSLPLSLLSCPSHSHWANRNRAHHVCIAHVEYAPSPSWVGSEWCAHRYRGTGGNQHPRDLDTAANKGPCRHQPIMQLSENALPLPSACSVLQPILRNYAESA